MSRKILVVDDEQGIREILQEDLISEGFEVKTSSTVTAAIVMIRENRFDLIFSDYHMANGSSIDLLKEVRILYPEMPFYIVSGFTDYVETELKTLGVTGILKKPYSLDELRSLLT